MGMGFAGAFADVIKDENLAEIVPEAWSGVLKLLAEDVKEQDWFLTVMAYLWMPDIYGIESIDPDWLKPESAFLNDEDEDVVNKRITEYDWVFDKLRNDFTEATKVGESELELCMGYHDSDSSGDRYDEVSGAYFHVDGCYAPTPAAKDLIKDSIIERQWFVVLG
jgi:hypothetical protein